jgi:hypothetical protein
MLDSTDRLDCGCSVAQRTYLYVGKNVLLRSRIQQHVFGKRHEDPSPWLTKYQEEHGHDVYYEAWYQPKHRIATIENWLIGKFSPLHNRQQTSEGFWDPSSWIWEPPFVHGNASDVTVGRTALEMNATKRSWLKNTSGVYAFYVDPGNDLLAAHEVIMSMPGLRKIRGDYPLPKSLLERARSARTSKRFLSSYPSFKMPIWIQDEVNGS